MIKQKTIISFFFCFLNKFDENALCFYIKNERDRSDGGVWMRLFSSKTELIRFADVKNKRIVISKWVSNIKTFENLSDDELQK